MLHSDHVISARKYMFEVQNSSFMQYLNDEQKNISFVTIFPRCRAEFPDDSLSFPCLGKTLSIPGLWLEAVDVSEYVKHHWPSAVSARQYKHRGMRGFGWRNDTLACVMSCVVCHCHTATHTSRENTPRRDPSACQRPTTTQHDNDMSSHTDMTSSWFHTLAKQYDMIWYREFNVDGKADAVNSLV